MSISAVSRKCTEVMMAYKQLSCCFQKLTIQIALHMPGVGLRGERRGAAALYRDDQIDGPREEIATIPGALLESGPEGDLAEVFEASSKRE